jgi:tol-pal system protein YbgF
MKRFFPIALLLGGMILSACAAPQQLAVIEKEQKRLRTEISRLRRGNTAIQGEMDGMRSRLADTRATLREMQGEVSVLKEAGDEVRVRFNREIGQSTLQGDQKVKELDARIAGIEDELRAQGALLRAREQELLVLREVVLRTTRGTEGTKALGRLEATSLPAPRTPEVIEASPAVRNDYNSAWKLLEGKDYRGAIARFKTFLRKHPRSNLADNAQYWVGESYYALKEFDQAILEFDAVRRSYPKGEKVPAALLKQGFAFAELGDKVDARLILQELVERYPESREAGQAKKKIKALES